MIEAAVHVAMSGDRNILWGMAVAGRSALDRVSAPIGFNILGTGFTAQDRRKLERSWQHPNMAYVRFHDVDFDDIKAFRSTAYLKSKAAYSRYFVGRIEGAGRIVYMDTDLLVLRDLAEAAALDLNGKSIAAVIDISARQHPRNEALKARLELRDESHYFNSGFLVIDMDRWRADDIENKLIDVSVRLFDRLDSQDQDALNIVFEDDVLLLDPSWNTSQYEADADVDGVILHLIGSVKPWHADYAYKFRDRFYRWLDETAYAGCRARSGGIATTLTRFKRRVPTGDMVRGKLRRLLGGPRAHG